MVGPWGPPLKRPREEGVQNTEDHSSPKRLRSAERATGEYLTVVDPRQQIKTMTGETQEDFDFQTQDIPFFLDDPILGDEEDAQGLPPIVISHIE